jgi:thiol-disulfide isomerase/thioredoxin
MRIKLSAVFSSVKFYGVVAVLATSVAVAYWLRTTHVQVPDYAGNSVTIYPRSIFNREVVDVRSGKRVRLVPDRRPVLLVLLSGTECPSCLDENAVWERLAEYREQLRVIGVFTGTTTEDVDAYVRMRRPTFEMYRLSGRDPLSQEYARPVKILLDRWGRVLYAIGPSSSPISHEALHRSILSFPNPSIRLA